VVAPLRPKTVTIAAGKTSVTQTLRVNVINADLAEVAGHTVQLTVSSTDCPVGLAGTPDFGKAAVGSPNHATIPGGKFKTAKVPLTFTSGAFTTFNHVAPTRCTLSFTATTLVASNDPTPQNAVASIELNVIDKNDLEGTARHESLIKSIAPVKVMVSKGTGQKLVTVRATAVNADILPAPETSADAITVVASDGDCPSGTVGVLDYDSTTAGAQNTVQLTGGKSKGGAMTVAIFASKFSSPNAKSPARCTALLTATGPGGDTDASNNTARLVIDVIDKNDF
jgi:hypothetical protein